MMEQEDMDTYPIFGLDFGKDEYLTLINHQGTFKMKIDTVVSDGIWVEVYEYQVLTLSYRGFIPFDTLRSIYRVVRLEV